MRDIPWYEWIYKITENWEVISSLWLNPIIKKPVFNGKWYLTVQLHKDSIRKRFLIHRLVLLAYVWDSDLQCNHIDWDKTNNKLSNLEYCTQEENIKHAFRTWLSKWILRAYS